MYNIQKNINQKNESERLELFFHHISQLLNIHYNIEYGMLKYEMLSIENQRKLNKYYNIIKEEALLRSSYREREYQWYINENTLKETINNINNIIELFDNCNQEEDEKLYLNYMMHANATESEKIRLLFSEKFNEERIDYNQLMYHIKLNELKKKIEIQTNLRLKKIDETNSYYYKNHKDAIEVCMEKICELNKIMNEATDISLFNIFYDLLKKELAMENLSHISDELFIETIFKIYSYKSKIIKKYSIYYLLPRNSRDLISNLKIHCMREYELRKNTPSRGLSNNFLQDLLKFRNWLQYNIIAILEGNCINEKKKIIDLLGSTVRTYQKTMLYDIFLKKWANANANENKNIPSILISYLDIADKERIDCVKELLKTVYEELLNNEKELNEIKRLQDNTNHIKNIHYNALFFDDGEDNKELLLLRKEKATYLEEVNKEVQRINEKFKSQKYTMSGDEIATIESNLSAESKKRDNNREVYPMLFDIDWKCDEHKAIYPEYFRYYYLLVNNNYYNLFKNTMIYSIKEVVVVYKQCKEEVENKKINQKEAETIKSMEDELLAKPEYKNYATNGEKRIKKLENKIHNAFPNALCLGHVTKIPENIFSYLFKIKIKNKIQALLMEKEFFINLFKEEELELVKEEKMDHKEREYHDNEENDNEQEIVHLYKLNSETDNKKFLKLLLLDEYKNIRNIDEMYEILNLLLSDYYNTERNKAHYLFSGPPGSGKTAMTVYMIQEYIKTIKHAELRKNLENETILFQVSQAFYTTEGKINNLFYSDVDKIVKQNENKNIIILFDLDLRSLNF